MPKINKLCGFCYGNAFSVYLSSKKRHIDKIKRIEDVYNRFKNGEFAVKDYFKVAHEAILRYKDLYPETSSHKIAVKTGVSQTTLAKVIRGEAFKMSEPTFNKIIKGLEEDKNV